LDPAYLVSGGKELVNKTIDIVEKFSTAGHIFNLGHGITPNAKIENVELLIKTIKDKI
jgi:uroporphyrinogen decarboxylase